MAFGIDPAAAQAWLDEVAEGQDEVFGIWPSHLPVVSLFLALRTQWRVTGFGRVLGLDYPSVVAAMDLRGVKRKRRGELFHQLRTMETAALGVLNSA